MHPQGPGLVIILRRGPSKTQALPEEGSCSLEYTGNPRCLSQCGGAVVKKSVPGFSLDANNEHMGEKKKLAK